MEKGRRRAGWQVRPDRRAQLDLLDPLVQRVVVAVSPDRRDQRARPGLLGLPVQMERLDPRENPVQLAQTEPRAQLVPLALRDLKAARGHKGRRAKPVKPAVRVCRVILVHREQPARLARLVPLDRLDRREFPGRRGARAQLATQGAQDPKGSPVMPDLRALRDRKVRQGLLAAGEAPVYPPLLSHQLHQTWGHLHQPWRPPRPHALMVPSWWAAVEGPPVTIRIPP